MSRSYKKVAQFDDYSKNYTPYMKRYANKKVRKNWNIPNGGAYKKIFEQWLIKDINFLYFTNKDIDELDKKYKAFIK